MRHRKQYGIFAGKFLTFFLENYWEMARHLPFTKDEFKYLFSLIEEKYGQKLSSETVASAFFGCGGYDPFPLPSKSEPEASQVDSLKYKMLHHPEVWKYLGSIPGWWDGYIPKDDGDPEKKEFARKSKFNGQQLQKKHDLVFGKDPCDIKIKDVPYANSYIVYSGICTAEQAKNGEAYKFFIEKYKKAQPKISALEEKKGGKEGDSESNKIEYVCYYYSYTDIKPHKVKSFNLTIDFARMVKYDPDKPDALGYYVEETDFHDYDESPRVFSGYAYKMSVGGKLMITLKEKKDKLDLVFNSGLEPQKRDFMLGSLSGISTIGDLPPITMEVIAVKNDPQILTKTNTILIHRYLNLNRRSFVVSAGVPDTIEELKHRDKKVEELGVLCGHYRLWRFDEQHSEIIESHFHLDECFNALCKTKQFGAPGRNNQVGLLKLNYDSDIGNSIFITTFSSGVRLSNAKILSSILLKPFQQISIPGRPNDKNMIAEGVLITRGREGGLLLKRAIVFQKVDSEKEIVIGSHTIRKVLKRAAADTRLKEALDKLLGLEFMEIKNILLQYIEVKTTLSDEFPGFISELDRKGFKDMAKKLLDIGAL